MRRNRAVDGAVSMLAEPLEGRVLMSAALADFKHGPLNKIGEQLGSSWLDFHTRATQPRVNPRAIALDAGFVQIEAFAKTNTPLLAWVLKNLHASDVQTYSTSVTANIAVAQLNRLAALAMLQFARPILYTTSTGSVTSQSDVAERADIARNTYGLSGAGVKVGVLSDSFNTSTNTDKYANDIASGDLPNNVQVLSDASSPATDEGRAMAQVVYDSAPGASLAFATGQGGQTAFASNIKALRDTGAKVIVDDLTYLNEPMFEDGVVAQAVDNVVASGVTYFSAAGNLAQHSYESAWRTGLSRADGSISSIAGAPHFYGGTSFDFDPSAATNDLNSFTLGSNQSITLSFQWDSPYFSANGHVGSSNEMDAYVLNAAGNQVVGGSATSNVGNDPTEVFQFTNTTGAAQTYNLMLTWDPTAGGSQPGYLKYVDFGTANPTWAFTTNSGTAFGHTNASGAESVGAAAYQSTPAFGTTPPLLESFCSSGGTPIFFDAAGNRLGSSIVRQTPDIVAPDNGDNTFFGSDTDANGKPNFRGTSAAAPTAAAVAALLLQKNPSLTPALVDSALQSSAIDMGTPGVDFASGYGLIRADAAIASIAANATGTVFQDNNGNATKDAGEPGIAGATVFFDANNNGALDAGEPSTVTDGSGNYTLSNVNAGNDAISLIVPSNYVATLGSKTLNLTGGGTATANLGLFPIVFTGTSGNDSYSLQVDAGNSANVDVLVGGALTYMIAKSLVPSLTFNLGDGDDALTIDYTRGTPLPADGITYDGGNNATTAGDSLNIVGSANADTISIANLLVSPSNGVIALTNVESATVNGNGGNDALTLGQSLGVNVAYDGGTGTNTLIYLASASATETLSLTAGSISNGTVATTYSNLQTLNVTMSVFNDVMNVSLAAGAPNLTITANSNPCSVNLNAGSSGSAVTVLANSAAAVTIASGYASPVDVHGNGSGNSLIFNATAGDDAINLSSTALSAGVSSVTYANIKTMTINALGGNDGITIGSAPPSSTTLTVNGGGGNDTLTINAAMANTGTVFNGGTTAGDQDTLTVNAGTFQLAGDPQVGTASLTINDNANVVFTAAASGGISARHLAALNIGANATATVNSPALQANRAVLVLPVLSINASGKLDLGSNDMLVQNTAVAAINALLFTGFTGNWTGFGIASSAAHNEAKVRTAPGAIQNTVDNTNPFYSTFDGQAATIADVLVKYTYYGDTDLNGSVDGADYARTDTGFVMNSKGWLNGDFTYDGVVDGGDYGLMDNAFNTQSGVVL